LIEILPSGSRSSIQRRHSAEDEMVSALEGTGTLIERDAILDMRPIRRIATLEEVAETVCFLAGPSAGYITGETVNVAGGFGI
jgi:NAD(P)-dependent dehydrogenase (short-subunit alcohol dehydrogenase family)